MAKEAIIGLLGRSVAGCTVDEVADAIGLHITTTRVHLNALVDSGLVLCRDERQGVGRPRRRYFPAPQILRVAELRESYHLLAEVLEEVLESQDSHDTAERVLAAWAERSLNRTLLGVSDDPSWREQGQAITALLKAWGYQPTLVAERDDSMEVTLHSCPLLRDDAREQAAICAAHLGVVRGAMRVLGANGPQVHASPQLPGGPCHLWISRDSGLKGDNS